MNLVVASLWQGALIAIVTTLAVRLVPSHAAGKRHLIWWVALVLILALPFVEGPGRPGGGDLLVARIEAIETGGFTLPMPPAWLMSAVVALWAGMTLVHGARLARGVRALRRLVKTASPLDSDRLARLSRWQAARCSGRAADLRVSPDISGAYAIGFRHPTILISAKLAAGLSDEALESIVLHEYAHLEHYDDWARVAQRLIHGVAWWHPAVVWISRHIDLEREIACDQRVVARTNAPLAYARNLAEAAALIAPAPSAALMAAPGASTTMPILRLRVERLIRLAPVRNRSFAVCASASVAALVVAAAIWLSQVPLLVTFATRVAQTATPATLGSVSFLTDLAHELPAAFADRGDDLAAPSEISARPLHQALVELPEQVPVGIEASASDSGTVQDAVAPESMVPVASVQLGSTSVPFLARVPKVESTTTVETDGVDWAALGRPPAAVGIAVARAGTATGLAASRAGTSVSRFFKNGGIAFARTF